MKPAAVLRLFVAIGAVALLTAAYHRASTVSLMTQTAQTFLNSLSPEQKAKAAFDFKDEERANWFYTPVPRKGLQIREMSLEQQHLASALLAAGVSQIGYVKAVQIMSIEEVLRLIENSSTERRNPGKYYISIFGEPSDNGVWGYRVEGHHLSLNFTVANGKLQGSPAFFGSNPAKIPSGPHAGLRILADEEDKGRELLKALDAGQQKTAIVDATAYPDMLTKNDRKAALSGQPSGLSAAKMTAAQRKKLDDLLMVYVENHPDPIASQRRASIKAAGTNLHFAWAGGKEPGDPHYYRVQGPDFLVEYDNTQNDANHIHSVWREYTGDFGGDLLAAHYKTSH